VGIGVSCCGASFGFAGRAVSGEYIQVLRFRDGRHASFNLLFDRLSMLEQLGLVPAPAEA
jgi:ketosteroid isomerase-like protein